MQPNRRQCLQSAGTTALAAILGADWLAHNGLAANAVETHADLLHLGEYEELANLFVELDHEPLLVELVKRIQAGEQLERLTVAGALANARALAGRDYEGFHAYMGMVPALAIARELPPKEAPLPVLKTLLRSAGRIRARGDRPLQTVQPQAGELRTLIRGQELERAEQALAAIDVGAEQWRAVTEVVRDDIEVHLVVFAWRAQEISEMAGPGHALTSLRQILHFADGREAQRRDHGRAEPEVRACVANLLDKHDLSGGKTGSERATPAAVSELADTLVNSSRSDGAGACAEALAGGIHPGSVVEALCLASTRLVLRDPGRSKAEVGRPLGSVHGASVGVHASDSALAWSGIAHSLEGMQRSATLLAGAFHTAGQSSRVGASDYGYKDQLQAVRELDPESLVGALVEAVQGGEQARAGAIAAVLSDADRAEELFSVLRPISVSQDGALHAEKYQHTARQVHRQAHPAFKSEHLVAYARVVASQACGLATEVAQARELL